MSQTRIVVPYRRWRYFRGAGLGLVISNEAKRLFKFMEGKTVEFEHRIINDMNMYSRRSIRDGTWYDQITVTIERKTNA